MICSRHQYAESAPSMESDADQPKDLRSRDFADHPPRSCVHEHRAVRQMDTPSPQSGGGDHRHAWTKIRVRETFGREVLLLHRVRGSTLTLR